MRFKLLKEYDHSFYSMQPDLSGKYNKGQYREPTYNREKDYLESKASELEVRKYFISKGFEFIKEGSYMYDAMFKCKEEKIVEGWAVNKYWTVEVKESFKSQLTGNVAIEFEQHGHSSGVAQTQADFWVEKIHERNGKITFIMMWTKDLRKMIAEKKYHTINTTGGDPDKQSKVYLFDTELYKQHGKTLNIKTY